MKVSIVSRKLIKPATPTPQDLKTYHISFIDELNAPVNVSLVLYYKSRLNHQSLEESLAKILPHFYPLAGRYIKKESLVDCSDQGAEFIVAKASDDVKLVDVIAAQQQLEDLLPRGSKDNPLLSIQLTEFSCGGAAMSVSVLHRIFDASSLALFLAHWAEATNPDHKMASSSLPRFDAASFFPAKNFPTPEEPEGTSPDPPKLVLKRFLFNWEAITALKTRNSSTNGSIEDGDLIFKNSNRPASRVRLVSALISRALIRVDRAQQGRTRDCRISQAVNLRSRTVPPLPEHTCGNLLTVSVTPHISADEAEHMEFRDLVSLLGDVVGKTLADCAEILPRGEAGHAVILDSVMSLMESVMGGETNVLWFSDWSKFEFYETADFGWGKPVWASIGSLQTPNLAVLMPEREGGGIEAWVHLDPESMAIFEKDEEIKSFTSS